LFEAAEFEDRGTMGFVGGHARLEVFGGKHCEVGVNFLVEIGLDLASGKDISEEVPGFAKERHDSDLFTTLAKLGRWPTRCGPSAWSRLPAVFDRVS
jgi:hypothetical protein